MRYCHFQSRHHHPRRRFLPTWAGTLTAQSALCLPVILASVLFFAPPASAQDRPLTLVSDQELDSIHASGLYFRMDLSLEVSTLSDVAPQVVLNAGTPIVIPVSGGGTGLSGGSGGNVTLADNAQSNLSSLVNVIGTASVINIGVNIVDIANSANDTIYTTNINAGAQGSGFSITMPILP
jgi:hypothetical protein